MRHVRPGTWTFSTNQSADGISLYDQYSHLGDLRRILDQNPQLKTALGGDYFITPDIVVSKAPLSDDELNAGDSTRNLVGDGELVGRRSPIRAANLPESLSTLHASVSCKWTIRSDRVQNTRTEALNLLRNRKGKTPHVIAVTAEPLPSRIASIAMGTGDLDCVYHAALDELLAAGREDASLRDQLEILETLVAGRRLRDISDLPLDLAL